jgi:hypothetical protein
LVLSFFFLVLTGQRRLACEWGPPECGALYMLLLLLLVVY